MVADYFIFKETWCGTLILATVNNLLMKKVDSCLQKLTVPGKVPKL